MAKKVKTTLKLQIPAGKATPAPPIGPALGQHGVNIMDFCKAYNDQTKDKGGMVIPVELTIYEDRSFTFILKTPPASILIRKALAVDKGSSNPGREKLEKKLNKQQLEEIATIKMPDLNANNLEEAVRIIEGSARSMGIEVSK
ncbi:50S ribosomal protein L11 [bacterium]|jgi:large subunit ribosomal protein L11|nr:50S ribosomal protein L11 [bacterium]MBT3581220.1 50S ribosomal protein L11 [bacterium]MBT4552365.1 50S ribosomal protein L11 [bacterium]MBT5988326.1 50S ribosomal protein L11 [bacterium]MBT7088235.1 50S ribosomal protein L11 [bacterium]